MVIYFHLQQFHRTLDPHAEQGADVGFLGGGRGHNIFKSNAIGIGGLVFSLQKIISQLEKGRHRVSCPPKSIPAEDALLNELAIFCIFSVLLVAVCDC